MTLAERLQAYLADLWGRPVAVENLSRIPGGASRETYRFDAVVGGERRGLILRRDPTASLIDTDRRLEFLAFRSFQHTAVPVPEAIALEPGSGHVLERPFFLMGRIEGGAAASPFNAGAYAPHEAALGKQVFQILGAIAAADPAGLPLAEVAPAPAPDQAWARELAYWEGVIDADELHPQPIVRAAIRSLRRYPPAPAQKIAVVHGDYRSGNFLHDGAGRIVAVLDWEMAHLGDPLEDLGWVLDPLWGHFVEGYAAGLIPRAEAIAIWERASGLTADPAALAWWELFAAVKGLGIWISAAKEFVAGGLTDPVLAFSACYTARRHDLIVAERLVQRLERLEAAA